MTQIAFCRLRFHPFNYSILDEITSSALKRLMCPLQFPLAVNKLHDCRKTKINSRKRHIGWITRFRVNNPRVGPKLIMFSEGSDPVTDYWPLAAVTELITEKRDKHHLIFES
jgi:hypothetical protein